MKTECGGVSSGLMVNKEEGEGEKKGPWTPDEDELLIRYVRCHGEGHWNSLAKSSGLKRAGKSCRLRWLNYLKPGVKRGDLTLEEQLKILLLHCQLGNKWSKIAASLPGRTDNEIKNYWRTRVQQLARKLNMDPNSQSFIDTIQCYYIPILVQKIEQNSTNPISLISEGSSTYPVSQNTHLIYSKTMLASDINKDNPCPSINIPNRSILEPTLLPGTTDSFARASPQIGGDGYYANISNYNDMDFGSMPTMNNHLWNSYVAGQDWMVPVWDDMVSDIMKDSDDMLH